jgi:hypothetical protein
MPQYYQSSRLTSGNRLFPDSISVDTDGVHYRKRRLFGWNEEVVNFRHIASVKVHSGVFFATVQIETAGGSQPVIVRGLAKSDATVIRESIQKMQQRGESSTPGGR